MSKPVENRGRTRWKRANNFYATFDRRTHDPWAITAPADPHYHHSRYDGHRYYRDDDRDELTALLKRGMEVD